MASTDTRCELSLIIPAWNEASRLPATLTALRDGLSTRDAPGEIIVVDDGSDDATAKVAEAEATPDFQIRVIRHPQKRGKGAAVRSGMLAANGELRLMLDADLATPLEELEKLKAWAARGYDVVFGSRRAPDARIDRLAPFSRRCLDAIFRAMRRQIILPDVLDTQCGFKLFTARAAQGIFSLSRVDGFLFDCEVLALARRLGFRIKEVGVVWRDHPDSRVRPWIDAPRMMVDLLRLRRTLAKAALPEQHTLAGANRRT